MDITDQIMTRRKLLAALGLTGAALASGAALAHGGQVLGEQKHGSGTVSGHVYGGGDGCDSEKLAYVDTIASLLACNPSHLDNNRIVFVSGYNQAGDGGAKFVRWEPDSTKSANGLIHDPYGGSGQAGRWETVILGRMNAEAMGAVGPDPTDGVAFAFASGLPVCFTRSYSCRPFSVSDAIVDAEFAPGGELVFVHDHTDSAVFNRCGGSIHGMHIRDSKDAVGAGILMTLRLNECTNLTISDMLIENGKDLPVLLYDCDNCWVVGSKGIGITHRPFAWESVGSKNSGFDKCRLDHYQFGFTLIGPGYKSGTHLTSRDWADTVGQKALDCYVYDYTGHAFDMNGTVGCEFVGCIAEKYTGTVGNSSFQIKQSTNIPQELKDATWLNRIVRCTAIDCITGFGTQAGTDAHFIDNQVIRAARYGASFNATPRSVIKGLTVHGWGMNLQAWPLLNGDTVCSAVALWNGSTNCYVDDLTLVIKEAHSGIPALTGILASGHNSTVGRMTVVKSVAATLHSAIVISGNNIVLSPEFRIASPVYYANNAVIDNAGTTIYPLSYGLTWSADNGGNHTFHHSPHRGMIVGKIVVTPASAATGGIPDYSVGWAANPAGLVSLRPVPGTTSTLNASTYISTGMILQAKTVPNGAVSGEFNIRVEGVHLL